MRLALRRLALAFSFLTRLPVHPSGASDVDVGRSLAFFPLVGGALGVVVAAAAWLLAGSLPASIVALLLVALLALLTGALHLDGLADTFDALGASGDRERRLEVLRDSRIGAHGASALFLVLLLKVAALQAVLATMGPSEVVAFPVVARAVVALQVLLFPYARSSGLGVAFRAHARGVDGSLAVLTAFAVLAFAGGGASLAALGTAIVVLGFARFATRRFGGLTGDVHGASIELGEVAFLVLTLLAP